MSMMSGKLGCLGDSQCLRRAIPLSTGRQRIRTRVRCLDGGGSHKKSCSQKSDSNDSGSLGWKWALYASLAPWMDSLLAKCSAADFVGLNEVQPVDQSAILVGDLVMLLLAPIFIYAALKMMLWGEEADDESDNEPSTPLDPLLAAHVKSVVKREPKSNYTSILASKELRDLAEKASVNIASAVQDAKETCVFQSSLHDLAVSHGGATLDNSWIDQVLQKAVEEVRNDPALASQLALEATSKNPTLCQTMTRAIAERTAVHELRELMLELQKYKST